MFFVVLVSFKLVLSVLSSLWCFKFIDLGMVRVNLYLWVVVINVRVILVLLFVGFINLMLGLSLFCFLVF